MNRYESLSLASGLVLLLLLTAGLTAGCVERELFIHSDPPGADVFVDGIPRGTTPVKVSFDFYGTRQVELRLAGHYVYTELLEIDPPLYQVFPFDFFCEVLLPIDWVDSREVDVRLELTEPEELDDEEEIIERARELRRSS